MVRVASFLLPFLFLGTQQHIAALSLYKAAHKTNVNVLGPRDNCAAGFYPSASSDGKVQCLACSSKLPECARCDFDGKKKNPTCKSGYQCDPDHKYTTVNGATAGECVCVDGLMVKSGTDVCVCPTGKVVSDGMCCDIGTTNMGGVCCGANMINSNGMCCDIGTSNMDGVCCGEGMKNSLGVCCRSDQVNLDGVCVCADSTFVDLGGVCCCEGQKLLDGACAGECAATTVESDTGLGSKGNMRYKPISAPVQMVMSAN
eukprot:GDKI01005119.1.p1 GENE.GDKI01005119.1~~GDKI01005119.1.p1  ORF type:complete len:258 (-),score=73.30 GDKI01005119.1:177-950(-)